MGFSALHLLVSVSYDEKDPVKLQGPFYFKICNQHSI